MRCTVQRVTNASVTVSDNEISKITNGLLIYAGIAQGDSKDNIRIMASKLANLRIFQDGDKPFHRSLLETGFSALVVSQFTLFADTTKGRRPEFFMAAKPEIAEPLCLEFLQALTEAGIKEVKYGVFGAHMIVKYENQGPVTINLEF